MTLINLLAETTPQDTNELLAETDSQPDFISLPSSGSLFAIGLATATLLLAGFLLFLYRGLSGGPETEPIDTEEGSFLSDEPESETS